MFYFRQTHSHFPKKHILVCEDVLINQIQLLSRLSKVVPSDGSVEISTLPGTISAANFIRNTPPDLIIADHDMTMGNTTDLLNWMKKENIKIPIITASGIPLNNENMMILGAAHKFTKQEVIDGKADELIKKYIS